MLRLRVRIILKTFEAGGDRVSQRRAVEGSIECARTGAEEKCVKRARSAADRVLAEARELQRQRFWPAKVETLRVGRVDDR